MSVKLPVAQSPCAALVGVELTIDIRACGWGHQQFIRSEILFPFFYSSLVKHFQFESF